MDFLPCQRSDLPDQNRGGINDVKYQTVSEGTSYNFLVRNGTGVNDITYKSIQVPWDVNKSWERMWAYLIPTMVMLYERDVFRCYNVSYNKNVLTGVANDVESESEADDYSVSIGLSNNADSYNKLKPEIAKIKSAVFYTSGYSGMQPYSETITNSNIELRTIGWLSFYLPKATSNRQMLRGNTVTLTIHY